MQSPRKLPFPSSPTRLEAHCKAVMEAVSAERRGEPMAAHLDKVGRTFDALGADSGYGDLGRVMQMTPMGAMSVQDATRFVSIEQAFAGQNGTTAYADVVAGDDSDLHVLVVGGVPTSLVVIKDIDELSLGERALLFDFPASSLKIGWGTRPWGGFLDRP